MKFIVPISSSDTHKLNNWLDVIIKFGNLANHSITLLPTLGAQEDAQEALNRLVENGIQAEIQTMQISPNSGWPRATNVMFFWAARHAAGQHQPWMWMELDCLPVRSNWADALAGAYANGGSRFLGCIVKTPWKDSATGKMVPSPEGKDDDMMCGCGIYPNNMATLEECVPLFNSFMTGDNSPDQGFDIFMRSAIKAYGRANTQFIVDKWNTGNYTLQNGVLSCKQLTKHENIPDGSEMMDIGGTQISSLAATVHGCKDDSLYQIIMGGLDLAAPPKPQSTETASFGLAFAKSSSESSAEIETLRGEVSELKIMLRQALANRVSAPDAASSEPITPASSSTLDRLVKLMESSPKRIRLHQASEKLNIPINKLKKAIEAQGSPVKSGALGWLSLVEAKV